MSEMVGYQTQRSTFVTGYRWVTPDQTQLEASDREISQVDQGSRGEI